MKRRLLLGRGHEGLALAGPQEPRLLPLSPPGGGVALSAIPLRLPSDGAGGLLLGPRLDAPLVEDVGAPHGEMVLPDQARVVAFEGGCPGGVPYQTYVDSLHAIGGVAIKAVGF
ncbi:hypothetical protein WME98_16040 [Sorangium sp. So ce296]|uniref:hypothetical protein n=1 Tax=Sorangium sp. So ce296 TaxID=3133296 RepID=UPI003F61B5BF